MAAKSERARLCRAVWYHGEPRAKHVCHRDSEHRGPHHADSGLTWGRAPHARRARIGDDPCPDCQPAGTGARR
jgi:hypothetical protein